VHLVRSAIKYTSKKYWSQICAEMREIYTAPSLEAAEARFGEFAAKWRDKYPAMIAMNRPGFVGGSVYWFPTPVGAVCWAA